ncbi:MAG: protein kinase [Planctomycetaceae bacterium]
MKSRIRVVSKKQNPVRRQTYYDLVGVPRSASNREILDAIAKRSTEASHTPDSDLAQLKEAVRTLTDPDRRRHYDMRLESREGATVRTATSQGLAGEATVVRPPSANRENPRATSSRKIEPIRVLGINDHTRVVEGWQFDASRRVVVKQLSGNHRRDPFESEFADEATFLASINCPHIVEVYSVNLARGFYVMEYIDGGFKELLETGKPIDESTVKKWLREALLALSAVHQSGQFIGRLCAGSFLLTIAGELKLKDAPAVDQAGTVCMPREGQTCLAPELLSPNTFGDPGQHSDIYTVGYLMLQLLAGRRFSSWFKSVGKSPTSTAWMNWHGSAAELLPPCKSLLPALTHEFSAILDRMTAKRVSDRYDSTESILEALDNCSLSTAVTQRHTEEEVEEVEMPVLAPTLEPHTDNPPNIFAESEFDEPGEPAMAFLSDFGKFIGIARKLKPVAWIPICITFCTVAAFWLIKPETRFEPVADFKPEFVSPPVEEKEQSISSETNQLEETEEPANVLAEPTFGEGTIAKQSGFAKPLGTQLLDPTLQDVRMHEHTATKAAEMQEPNKLQPATAVPARSFTPPPKKLTTSQIGKSIHTSTKPHLTSPSPRSKVFDIAGGQKHDRDRLRDLLTSAIRAHVSGRIQEKREVVRRLQIFDRTAPKDPRTVFAIGCLTRGSEQLKHLQLSAELSSAQNLAFLEADRIAVELSLRSRRPARQVLGQLLVITNGRSEKQLNEISFFVWYGQIIGYLEFTGDALEKTLISKHLDQLPASYVARAACTRARRETIQELGTMLRNGINIGPKIVFPIDYSLRLTGALESVPSDRDRPLPAHVDGQVANLGSK